MMGRKSGKVEGENGLKEGGNGLVEGRTRKKEGGKKDGDFPAERCVNAKLFKIGGLMTAGLSFGNLFLVFVS